MEHNDVGKGEESMVRVGRRIVLFLAAALVLSGCSNHAAENGSSAAQTETETSQAETERTGGTAVTSLPQIDATKWKYNSDGKVYWQTGISYCADPADEEYETLGIFVPAAYMNAKDNGDGTFTCTINSQAAVKGYTADSAPIVIPVNTPGYSAMTAPTDYVADSASYTAAGFIYVAAGCRGRDAGAPAGVTDLKAAIRYIRYNDGVIPGDVDRVFSFGMSGLGAQSALLGATGDSEDYEPYLTAIGAVSGVSDAVTGSMCWCPITELDYADEAYEWNLGSTRTDLTEQEQTLSNGMAEAFAQYINDLGLKDSSGNVLTLTESEEGIYQSGTYYEYLKGVVETSLNNFLTSGFEYLCFLLALTLVTFISFVDDIKSTGQMTRLLFHFSAMAMMFYQWGLFSLSWWWIVIALIVCTGIINAYNFMDGINGITGGYSLVILAALAYINKEVVTFVEADFIYTVICSVLVFCFFNFRKRAKCFAGDVGSVSIAFILLFLIGRLIIETEDFSWIVLLSVYGVDSVLTIIHRLMLHENIGLPHRKHLYQIMANELKIPHVIVSLAYMTIQTFIIVGYIYYQQYGYIFLIGCILLLSVIYVLFMKKYFSRHIS